MVTPIVTATSVSKVGDAYELTFQGGHGNATLEDGLIATLTFTFDAGRPARASSSTTCPSKGRRCRSRITSFQGTVTAVPMARRLRENSSA